MPLIESRKNILTGIFIFSLALILRLIYLFFLKHNYIFFNDPASDVLYYQEWAKEIAGGNWIGHKVFWGMPLYPYFLALVYRLSLGNLFLVRLTHFILGSGNCVLVYFIAQYIFSKRIALLASILMATNFMMIYYDGLLMPVVLIITLSLLIVWILLKLNQNSPTKEWFLFGLIVGLSILADGKFFIFFVFLLMIFLLTFSIPMSNLQPAFPTESGDLTFSLVERSSIIRYYRVVRIQKIFLPLVFAVGMILFSVALRNRLVCGDWILVSAQSGLSFFVGNNPQASGIFENLDFIRPTHGGQDEDQQIRAEQILKRKLKPSEVSRFWMNQGLNFIKESPLRYLNLLKNKFYFFFIEHEWAHDIDLLLQREWKQKFDINSFSLICPLAFLGILLTFRSNPSVVFLNLFIVSQIFFTLMFFLTTKHRATILPFLMIYEAYTLDWIVMQVKGKKFKRILGIGCLLILFFIAFHPVEIDRNVVDFLRLSKSGDLFQKKGEYEKSKVFYFKALKINPGDTNLIYNLATTFFLNGQIQEAIEYYRKVLLLNPTQVDALYNLGYSYESLNQFDLACESYQRVLSLQPQSVDTHYRLANIYARQGNCQDATNHYRVIIQLIPSMQNQAHDWINACHPKASVSLRSF